MTGGLRQRLRRLSTIRKILWLGFTFSILIYVALAFVIAEMIRTPGDEGPGLLVPFSGVALAAAIGSWVFRHRAYSDERLRARRDRAFSSAGTDGDSAATRLDGGEDLTPAEGGLLRFAISLQTPFIVNLALNEFVAILGFVLALLNGDPMVILPFALVAILLNLTALPNLEEIVERVERMPGHREGHRSAI